MTEKRFMIDDCLYFKEKNKELLEENKQLKQTNQELYDKLQVTMSYKALKMGENSILEKENEQLRNRIHDWRQKAFKGHEYFNILEEVIDEVCNDEISNQIWKEYEKRERLIE